MKILHYLLTILLLAALVSGNSAPLVAKGKPGGGGGDSQTDVDIPVQISFANRSGDQILNVGDPTYADGQDGVTAVICASNGWVDLFTCGKRNPKSPCVSTGREQVFDYTWPVDGQDSYETHLAGGNWTTHPRDAVSLAHLPGGFRDIMNFEGSFRRQRWRR